MELDTELPLDVAERTDYFQEGMLFQQDGVQFMSFNKILKRAATFRLTLVSYHRNQIIAL